MKSTIDLQAVRSQLPYGAIKTIAKKVGLHQPTVSNIFSGLPHEKLPDVLKAAADIIAAIKAKERDAMQAISEAMSEA